MKIKVRIEGERPIIIQSDRLVDPLDPMSIEKRRLAKHKDKASEAFQADIGRIEWFGALYLDDDCKPRLAIPCDNILRAMRDAAAREKLGETVKREVTIDPPLIDFLDHGGPKDLEAMYADPRFVLRKSVAQQKARVMRVRPRLPVWAAEFTMTIGGAQTLTEDDVRRILTNAGMVGIGTWRPRYGHFRVTRFEKAKD